VIHEITLFSFYGIFHDHEKRAGDKWIPVTTARRVFRLRTEERIPIRRVAAKYWISSRGQPTWGGSPARGLGEALKTSHRINCPCYETDTIATGLVGQNRDGWRGCCESGNETYSSTKWGEFLD